MDEKNNIPEAVTDITLEDCMLQYPKYPQIENAYEDHFYLLMGEIENYDFLLCTAMVAHKGSHGLFEGMGNTTTFFMLPQETRGHMINNDFSSGYHAPWQYLGFDEVKVNRDGDQVVWEMPERRIVCRPPYWELQGQLKDIQTNLKLTSFHPAFWYLGHFEDVNETGSAGVDEFVRAEGTITVGGKEYEVSKAGGYHEHMLLSAWDQIHLVAQSNRYMWCFGWSEDIQFFTFYMPFLGPRGYFGRVTVGGTTYSFDGLPQVSVDERAFWTDPRSSFTIGSKWHINMRSPDAEFDVIMNNGGRSYHVNAQRSGYICRYWNMATANGTLTLPDGKVIPLENIKVAMDRSIAFSMC